VIAHGNLPVLIVLIITRWYNGVIRLWRRGQENSNFYEALRCHEVVGLAGVERIPPVSGAPNLVILNSATVLHPTLLPSSPYSAAPKKNTRVTKTLFSQYYGKTTVKE